MRKAEKLFNSIRTYKKKKEEQDSTITQEISEIVNEQEFTITLGSKTLSFYILILAESDEWIKGKVSVVTKENEMIVALDSFQFGVQPTFSGVIVKVLNQHSAPAELLTHLQQYFEKEQ